MNSFEEQMREVHIRKIESCEKQNYQKLEQWLRENCKRRGCPHGDTHTSQGLKEFRETIAGMKKSFSEEYNSNYESQIKWIVQQIMYKNGQYHDCKGWLLPPEPQPVTVKQKLKVFAGAIKSKFTSQDLSD